MKGRSGRRRPPKPRASAPPGRVWGIFGQPYLDLESALDLSALDALDSEISRGIAHVETTYTGGTLKWMGVVAPWAMEVDGVFAPGFVETLRDKVTREGPSPAPGR